MTQTSPITNTLEDLIEKLKSPGATVAAFRVSDGYGTAVRLECREGEIEIVLDVFVTISPADSSYHLEPSLTADSRFDLTSRGLLPADRFEALELGGWLASRLATAHRGRIIETAAHRDFCVA